MALLLPEWDDAVAAWFPGSKDSRGSAVEPDVSGNGRNLTHVVNGTDSVTNFRFGRTALEGGNVLPAVGDMTFICYVKETPGWGAGPYSYRIFEKVGEYRVEAHLALIPSSGYATVVKVYVHDELVAETDEYSVVFGPLRYVPRPYTIQVVYDETVKIRIYVGLEFLGEFDTGLFEIEDEDGDFFVLGDVTGTPNTSDDLAPQLANMLVFDRLVVPTEFPSDGLNFGYKFYYPTPVEDVREFRLLWAEDWTIFGGSNELLSYEVTGTPQNVEGSIEFTYGSFIEQVYNNEYTLLLGLKSTDSESDPILVRFGEEVDFSIHNGYVESHNVANSEDEYVVRFDVSNNLVSLYAAYEPDPTEWIFVADFPSEDSVLGSLILGRPEGTVDNTLSSSTLVTKFAVIEPVLGSYYYIGGDVATFGLPSPKFDIQSFNPSIVETINAVEGDLNVYPTDFVEGVYRDEFGDMTITVNLEDSVDSIVAYGIYATWSTEYESTIQFLREDLSIVQGSTIEESGMNFFPAEEVIPSDIFSNSEYTYFGSLDALHHFRATAITDLYSNGDVALLDASEFEVESDLVEGIDGGDLVGLEDSEFTFNSDSVSVLFGEGAEIDDSDMLLESDLVVGTISSKLSSTSFDMESELVEGTIEVLLDSSDLELDVDSVEVLGDKVEIDDSEFVLESTLVRGVLFGQEVKLRIKVVPSIKLRKKR